MKKGTEPKQTIMRPRDEFKAARNMGEDTGKDKH
jgi:hypothetical protein